jgi:toxin HigB-1
VIAGFRHKGLRKLFEDDDDSGIGRDLAPRIRTILFQLEEAQVIKDMRLTSFHLHALKGDRKGSWAVTVRANWRIVFRFENGTARDVELVDYH